MSRFEAHYETEPPLDGWQTRDTVTGEVIHAYGHEPHEGEVAREVVGLMNRMPPDEQDVLVQNHTSVKAARLAGKVLHPPRHRERNHDDHDTDQRG